VTSDRRVQALAAARAATPSRFSSDVDPKILQLPVAAWIKPPITQVEDQEKEPVTAAA
jgi:putative transposase